MGKTMNELMRYTLPYAGTALLGGMINNDQNRRANNTAVDATMNMFNVARGDLAGQRELFDAYAYPEMQRMLAADTQKQFQPFINEIGNLNIPTSNIGRFRAPESNVGDFRAPTSTVGQLQAPGLINEVSTRNLTNDPLYQAQQAEKHPLKWTAPFNVPGDFTKAIRTERYKYIWYITGEEELYDLQEDPGERNNLASDPACETVLQELHARLAEWFMQTEDPLCPKDRRQINETYPWPRSKAFTAEVAENAEKKTSNRMSHRGHKGQKERR